MALTRKKKIIIAVSAVALLALIIIISVFASRKDEAEVTTVKLEVKPELRQTVTASGEVRPIRYIKLTSEVPGRIEEIYVNPGDQVVQGKPLVRVDPTQLQSSQEAQFAAAQASINDITSARNAVATAQQGLVVAESSVASARQQLVALQTAVDRAQVDLNTAQRELKRASDLIEAGVASRSDYDAARDRFDQAKIALQTAKANLESQRISVKEAQERANQQKMSVQEAKTGIRSSEMRARPAAGSAARPVEPTIKGDAVVAAQWRSRRHSYARWRICSCRSIDHAADDDCRHVDHQRGSQR